MGYYNFPHTRNYDTDLGYLIKTYKELCKDYTTLSEYVKNLKTIGVISSDVKFLNTCIDLKESTILHNNDYVITSGYYNINDGGSALYKITNIVTDGSYYEALQNNLYAELIDTGVTNIEVFGVYGDNIHDDSINMQKALKYAKHTIQLKNTTYKIDNPLLITSRVKITGFGLLNFSDCNTAKPFVTIRNSVPEIDGLAIFAHGEFENTIPTEAQARGTGLFLDGVSNAHFQHVLVCGCKTGIDFGSHCYNLEMNKLMFFGCYTGINFNLLNIEDSGESLIFNSCVLSSCYLAIKDLLGHLVFNNCSIDYNRKIIECGVTNNLQSECSVIFNSCFFENRNEEPYVSTPQITDYGDNLHFMTIVFNSCNIGLQSKTYVKSTSNNDFVIFNNCIMSGVPSIDVYTNYLCDVATNAVHFNMCRRKNWFNWSFVPLYTKFESYINRSYSSFINSVLLGTAVKTNDLLVLTNNTPYGGANAKSESIKVPRYATRCVCYFKARASINMTGTGCNITAFDCENNNIGNTSPTLTFSTEYSNHAIDLNLPENTDHIVIQLAVLVIGNDVNATFNNVQLIFDL